MKVAVIGLGLMGLSIAKNVAKAGFDVKVFDLNSAAAASVPGSNVTAAKSPADAGVDTDVVLLSLPGPAEVEAVCLGPDSLSETLKPGAVIVDLSTNGVDVVKALEAKLAEKGINFLDGPVSGGPWGAADGTLAIWVGGDKAAFDKALPVLKSTGKAIEHMGGISTGTITKLVHNTGANIRHVMLSEIMNLGVKAGIEPLALFKAIREGSNGLQRTFDGVAMKYLDRTYDEPAFRLRHAQKDLRLALELADSMGLEMDLSKAVMTQLDEAMAKGWGDKDSTAVGLLGQEAAGIEIKPIDKTVLKEIVSK
ncbi:NAD(P)-dependent oxidoreductase [Rhizobium rhizogenes]|uniref:NAD(P)-dependent oxidoreductase n=1 Tax=Rhizobium rhizogenes TaxID=359 RepID=UPI001574730E|nr:NAD(P)-dependent oxidoreductase [Rhizobium rhizogenes]NTH22819.1 NAD(P)-dependent oxidoreductase [Rhizobium rhizogenes]NTH35849.1 NAD(P)-dependent oxidoreductase [Rhizobium rhizogenes]